MNENFFYRYLDWIDPIPDDLLSRQLSSIGENPQFLYAGTPDRQTWKDGEKLTNLHFQHLPLIPDLEEWIKKHVASSYLYARYGFTSKGDLHQVHTDGYRDYILSYIIDLGGSATVTSFYQQKNHPRLRSRRCHPLTYDDLEVLESVTLEARRWVLLNGLVLHDVANIETSRTRIDIAFEHPIRLN